MHSLNNQIFKHVGFVKLYLVLCRCVSKTWVYRVNAAFHAILLAPANSLLISSLVCTEAQQFKIG